MWCVLAGCRPSYYGRISVGASHFAGTRKIPSARSGTQFWRYARTGAWAWRHCWRYFVAAPGARGGTCARRGAQAGGTSARTQALSGAGRRAGVHYGPPGGLRSRLAHRPAPGGRRIPQGLGLQEALRSRPPFGPACEPPNVPLSCDSERTPIVDCVDSCASCTSNRLLSPGASSFTLVIGFCGPPGGPRERV